MKTQDTAPKLFGAKRPHDMVTLYVDDTKRRKYQGLYLGSGRFSSAYKITGNRVIIYSFFGDKSKNVLAQAYEDYKKQNRHLPRIKKIGERTWDKGKEVPWKVQVFMADYYIPLHHHGRIGEKVDTSRVLNALKQGHERADYKVKGHIINEDRCDEFNRYVIQYSKVGQEMKDALTILADEAVEWGSHYIFDNFRKANMGLNAKGHLVLIDPMFDCKMIDDYRNAVLGKKIFVRES